MTNNLRLLPSPGITLMPQSAIYRQTRNRINF